LRQVDATATEGVLKHGEVADHHDWPKIYH
jgi:hypothetical protein